MYKLLSTKQQQNPPMYVVWPKSNLGILVEGKHFLLWRRGGLIFSALVSRSGGLCSSSGQGPCVVSLDKTPFFTVPLSTQVYKWVTANLMLGVTLRWTSIPSRGSRNTPSRFMLQKPVKLQPDGPLGSYADFTFTKHFPKYISILQPPFFYSSVNPKICRTLMLEATTPPII